MRRSFTVEAYRGGYVVVSPSGWHISGIYADEAKAKDLAERCNTIARQGLDPFVGNGFRAREAK